MHRKARVGLLPAKSLLHYGVTAVNTNCVPGKIGRRKKRKPYNVVPMQMGHKKVIHFWMAGAVLLGDLLPKTAQAGAHVADHVVFAANDFHTGRVAAIAVTGWKI